MKTETFKEILSGVHAKLHDQQGKVMFLKDAITSDITSHKETIIKMLEDIGGDLSSIDAAISHYELLNDKIIKGRGKPSARSLYSLEQAAQCLDLLMTDIHPERFGLVRDSNEDGSVYLEGVTGTFASAFEKISAEHNLPTFKSRPEALGQLLNHDALGSIGWKKHLDRIRTGNRFFRYQRIGIE